MARKKKQFSFAVKTVLPDQGAIKKRLGVDENGRVQNMVTDMIIERIVPYLPEKSGALRASITKSTSSKITVEEFYARIQFFGVTKAGLPFNYNTANGGVKAGSHWDRRLMADEGASIVAEVNRKIRG